MKMPRAQTYKVDDRVQLQFRLRKDQRDRLKAEAKRRAISVNLLIETLLEDGLVKMEKEKTPRPRS